MSRKGDRRADDEANDAAQQRPPRVVSLLGQKRPPGEVPPPARRDGAVDEHDAGERPARAAVSGADPLRSAHSTFRDLEPPHDDFDPARARGLCAQVARDALRDFAPALMLLPAATRARAQAFIAYARTMLDFARDRSLEGERLAQINRLEFELEAALGGAPTGQPVFVQLAALERQQPWQREAFDEIASIARSRVSVGLPANARTADAQRHRLARAALRAMLGAPPSVELEAMGAAILRAASLLGWRESLWLDRPDLGLRAGDDSTPRFHDVVAAEARAAARDLSDTTGASEPSADLRAAARYAMLAAVALTREATAGAVAAKPPRLSAGKRIALLVRARLGPV
jgi:phytoene/squalene synthetase